MDNSALSKMQLHYWEAKQTFLKKIKRKEDDCVVASDAELDAKLELLKSIDETNQNLLNLLDLYQDRVCALAQEECIIGRFLRECSKVDSTKAGCLMSGSGKTLLFASHQFILLRNILIRIYQDVQTFQYRAVVDTFDTVEQMEKARTTYRAALLWMKDISKQLDPDAYNQMGKFKKVQEHVRKTRQIFEKLKIDTIQKIDLLSASRCNLFSNVLVSYQNNLRDIWGKTSRTMNVFVDTFKSNQSYEFTMLHELNDDSQNDPIETFENKLKDILAKDNISEKDMLIFFEADYSDDMNVKLQEQSPKKKSKETKGNLKTTKPAQNTKLKQGKKEKSSTNQKNESLLDLSFDAEQTNIKNNIMGDNQMLTDLLASDNFMPSSLIDIEHIHKINNSDFVQDTNFDEILTIHKNLEEKQQAQISNNEQEKKSDKPNTLESWLNLFSDIDPLSNPEEFDKKFASDKNSIDRNC